MPAEGLGAAEIQVAAPGGRALLWAVAPSLFLLPLLAQLLIAQWLAWRAPKFRGAVPLVSGFIIFVPFLAYVFREALGSLGVFSEGFFAGYGTLSPFTQLFALARPEGVDWTWILYGQIPHFVGVVALFVSCRRTVLGLAGRSRELLDGLDGGGADRSPGEGARAGA
jgi:hypothetical protein